MDGDALHGAAGDLLAEAAALYADAACLTLPGWRRAG
jgi:hypothetical protein